MGIAIANWAYYSGYDVTAITTVEIDMPYKTIKVDSALEMLEKLREIQNDNKEERGFDYLIMAAAVADFRSENINETKISKEHIKDEFILKLIKNPDIVSTVAKEKKEYQKIIGFCLADDDIINCAKKKLKNKNLDYIVANEIKTALNTDKNKVTIIDKSDNIIDIDLDTKENIAKKILEVVCD